MRFGVGNFGAGDYSSAVTPFGAVRQEIADALTVGDLVGYTEMPATPQQGDCWPSLATVTAAGPPGVMLKEWRVLVVLGGDPASAVLAFELYADQIADLLAPVGYVQSYSPVVIAGPNLQAIEYRLVRE